METTIGCAIFACLQQNETRNRWFCWGWCRRTQQKSPLPPIQYFVPDTVILQSIRAFAFSFGGGKHSSNENPTVEHPLRERKMQKALRGSFELKEFSRILLSSLPTFVSHYCFLYSLAWLRFVTPLPLPMPPLSPISLSPSTAHSI